MRALPNELRRQLLVAADFLSPGEVMTLEMAGMSMEALVSMICSATSATPPLLAIVALKLAQQLDALEAR